MHSDILTKTTAKMGPLSSVDLQMTGDRFFSEATPTFKAHLAVSAFMRRLVKDLVFDEHHGGSVIKCVRFRPAGTKHNCDAKPNIFASCGNDKVKLHKNCVAAKV